MEPGAENLENSLISQARHSAAADQRRLEIAKATLAEAAERHRRAEASAAEAREVEERAVAAQRVVTEERDALGANFLKFGVLLGLCEDEASAEAELNDVRRLAETNKRPVKRRRCAKRPMRPRLSYACCTCAHLCTSKGWRRTAVALTNVAGTAPTSSNEQASAGVGARLLPCTITAVPPETGPHFGTAEETAGTLWESYAM